MPDLLKLTPDKQKIFLNKIILKLIPVGKSQMQQINVFIKNNQKDNETIYMLLEELGNAFWRDLEFIVNLDNEWNDYSTVIARMVFEKYLKLHYFTKKKSADQIILANNEFMRMYKRFYIKTLNNKDVHNAEVWKKEYNLLKSDKDYEIDTNGNNLQSFPDIQQMLQKSGFPDWQEMYFNYKHFCEDTHAGVLNLQMKKVGNEFDSYIQALMFSLRYAIEAIKLMDYHLQSDNSLIIKECQSILKTKD